MELKILSSIDAIGREAWNAVSGTDNPFLRYEFLAALENNHTGRFLRPVLERNGRLA